MKVGNIVDGLTVIDVKRVRQMHPVRQYKEVVDYLDKGYKIDYTSAKLIGLVHEVDMYKLEGVTSEDKVESTEDYKSRLEKEGFSTDFIDDENKEELEPKTDEQRSDELNKSVEEAKKVLDTFSTPEQKRQTRSKKSTTESKEV